MYSIYGFVLLTLAAVAVDGFLVTQSLDFEVDPSDAQLTTVELISKYGYRPEIHQVQTQDGYLLEMHRVVGNTRGMHDPNRPPVFLMHGLLASSADFVLVGPNHALVYQLSDLGYDVWLGNARGNRYSRKHLNFTTNMNKFWNFSWHEIGIYDLPAMIDYVLGYTGKQKLHYLGHSQGTTSFFVMTSMRPEYNNKIVLMQAMAPVAFVNHMSSPLLKFFVDNLAVITTVLDLFGMGEFQPLPSVLVDLAKYICPSSQNNNLCVNVLFLLTGDNPEQIDPDMVPILLGHIPAGSSTKQVVHFGQEVLSAQFRQYDYGKLKNQFIYGQKEPPAYDLQAISTPIVLHYGPNDHLANVEDVQRLASLLPNLVESRRVEMEMFNHADFLLAKDAKALLYDHLIGYIEKYNEMEEGSKAPLEQIYQFSWNFHWSLKNYTS